MTSNPFSICPLASGSKGNAVLITSPDGNILVDAGLSGIQIEKRLERVGVSCKDISALIVTHEHSDHVKGAGVLSRRFDIPVYINSKTHAAASGLGRINHLVHYECGIAFDIGHIRIEPFSISHDACDPAGMTLAYRNKKIGIATDMGVITHLVRQHLKECAVLYLESNHDPDMLMNGSYPWVLKQRIKGRTGHLSNMDTRDFVRDLTRENLKHVILAHLSEENNTPQKAYETVREGLDHSGITLDIALPDQPGRIICI
jgi:phosphoribosyl 1,2-cyclic phosphodiesterase